MSLEAYMMASLTSTRKLFALLREIISNSGSEDIQKMFEPCLLRTYELLAEQRQRARLNKVKIKVSFNSSRLHDSHVHDACQCTSNPHT